MSGYSENLPDKFSIPIVILHGWNMSQSKFSPLAKHLEKKGFRVLVPDLPGFGANPPPQKAFDIPDYAKFVAEYLAGKKIRQIIIIGHSFGGRIAIVLASQYKSLIKALILTGTPGVNINSKIKILFFLILAKLGKVLFSFPLFINFRNIARKILYKIAGSFDYFHSGGIMRETFKKVTRYNLETHLPEITAPTLIIWGNNDKITPVSIGLKMKRLIPNATWICIPEANHSLPYKNAALFTHEISNFLKKEMGI